MEVNPAVVAGLGPLAGRITARAQELILRRNGLDALPPIFQFILAAEDEPHVEERVAEAYYTAANKQAALDAERTAGVIIATPRVESFVIAPLSLPYYEAALRVAHTLKDCSQRSAGGGRNAIFLLPKRGAPEDAARLHSVAEALDTEMRSRLPFNRCFFIDEVDESGHSIVEGEVVELVARFISLAVASELTRPLRTNPPPYIGSGHHHQGYGSFSCSTVGFDSQWLIDVLTYHLELDIRRHLFAECEGGVEQTGLTDQARAWLESSLQQPLDSPSSLSPVDMSRDPDFIKLREHLDEFTRSAAQALGRRFHAYQELLNYCLSYGVVRLEALAAEMAAIKKRISDIEIRMLLGHSCGQQSKTLSRQKTKKPWPLVGGLALAGLFAIAALVFISDGQPGLAHKTGMVVGAGLILVAAYLAIFGIKYDEEFVETTPVSCAAELERQKRLYAEQNKRQNIHVALLTYLDLAHANLEGLRAQVGEANGHRRRNVFDIDLIDDELARKFYDQEYKNREADIASFTTGRQFYSVHQSTFSFLNTSLTECLRQYCRERFGFIMSYNLGQIIGLRQSLGGYMEIQVALSPFWYPWNPTSSEKLIFAILPTQSPDDMRAVLSNTFGSNGVHYFHGQDPTAATLLQVSYGETIKNIFGSPPSVASS